jgi:hypothetical protein
MRKEFVKKEFVCDAACCVPNKKYRWKLGNAFATSLSGFVAGAIVATIMLYPWLRALEEACPSGR